jgi:hypothetical protein
MAKIKKKVISKRKESEYKISLISPFGNMTVKKVARESVYNAFRFYVQT